MDASFHIRPFQFGEVFAAAKAGSDPIDDLDPWLRIEMLRAELAIALQDSEQRAADARAEGFIAGQTEAREEQSAALITATDAIYDAIEGVEASLEAIAERTIHDAAEVACAAAEILAGHALSTAPTIAIDAAIGRALQQVARGQEIQVSVHPDLVAAIDQIIAQRQSGDRRRLALSAIGDPAVAWGDAHIHWDQGGIVLDAAVRADSIKAALAGLLPTS